MLGKVRRFIHALYTNVHNLFFVVSSTHSYLLTHSTLHSNPTSETNQNQSFTELSQPNSKKRVKPYQCFQSQGHGTSRRVKIPRVSAKRQTLKTTSIIIIIPMVTKAQSAANWRNTHTHIPLHPTVVFNYNPSTTIRGAHGGRVHPFSAQMTIATKRPLLESA